MLRMTYQTELILRPYVPCSCVPYTLSSHFCFYFVACSGVTALLSDIKVSELSNIPTSSFFGRNHGLLLVLVVNVEYCSKCHVLRLHNALLT